METSYSYVIIKENFPHMQQENAFLYNNYSPKKKYAYINKVVNNDGSESTAFIKYSNDIVELQNQAKLYVSWYNYPMGLYKNIQGYISELS